MSDKNSHSALTDPDDFYTRPAPKGDNVMPFAGEQWRGEMAEMHKRDQARQFESERVARELLALAANAPDDFAAFVYSYPVIAAYLLPVFEKAFANVEG
nr:hypothetical protein [Mesorhizobium sp. LSHC424B00]